MYTCFGRGWGRGVGGVLFPLVLCKIPRVTQWVLESYFRYGCVHMLVWSSSFLPAPHLTFLVTGGFPSKSLRLCLFLKGLHLYAFSDHTRSDVMWHWHLPASLTSLGVTMSPSFSVAGLCIISCFLWLRLLHSVRVPHPLSPFRLLL